MGNLCCNGNSGSSVKVASLASQSLAAKYHIEDSILWCTNHGILVKATPLVQALISERYEEDPQVVVKLRFQEASAVDRLLSEIHFLERLKHPNIVRMIDQQRVRADCWMVLEFLKGGDLQQHLSANRGLCEGLACRYMQAILDAVAYCHGAKIAHRDIKLENIMLTGGISPVLKLVDFETATLFGKTPLTLNVGTPGYSSPQMLFESYSNLCDTWSCGVVMFTMLCYRLPVIGDTDEAINLSVQQGHIDWNPIRSVGLSGPVDRLLKGLLAYEESARLTAADALQLEALQFDETLDAN